MFNRKRYQVVYNTTQRSAYFCRAISELLTRREARDLFAVHVDAMEIVKIKRTKNVA